MNILSVENLEKRFGSKLLFENATFGLDEGDRVGIIGVNGSGKSTMLRILAGAEIADAGRVAFARDRTVSYLSQNPSFVETATVLDTIFPAESEVMCLLRDYEIACAEIATSDDETRLERVAALTHRIELTGAWEIETNARMVLEQLGLVDTRAIVGTLSGGQRKRVALARVLITRPDLLILDEPTNHLDADTITWLESYLERMQSALLLVTHDRYFLDRITSRMLEIDRGRVQGFVGNFTRYLEQKEAQEALRTVEEQKRKSLVRRELAWLRRGAQARSTKAKARVERAEALVAQPKDGPRTELEISASTSRLGKKVLELYGVAKAYGECTVLDDFSYVFKRDDRIGIVGPNGAGKTTLLDIVVDRVSPDRGRVEKGATVVIGYYDQESRALDESKRVIDYVREVGESIETSDGSRITASQLLEKFLFSVDTQYALIERLSGGERRRLYLLRVLMGAPNVLLLDEPTNDLDIQTLETLEDYLDSFPGCLIVVSHDRYFLDRTVDHIFRFEGRGSIRSFPGNYTAAEDLRARVAAEATHAEGERSRPKPTPSIRAQPSASSTQVPRKLSFKEQRELLELEARLEVAESRKGAIHTEMAGASSEYERVQRLYAELQSIEEAIERDFTRWSELAERAE
jgi:ABC transport system ATP-binding/permease protein